MSVHTMITAHGPVTTHDCECSTMVHRIISHGHRHIDTHWRKPIAINQAELSFAVAAENERRWKVDGMTEDEFLNSFHDYNRNTGRHHPTVFLDEGCSNKTLEQLFKKYPNLVSEEGREKLIIERWQRARDAELKCIAEAEHILKGERQTRVLESNRTNLMLKHAAFI